MKRKLFFLLVCALAVKAQAQMSYQVSLLNTATGEPRANVTVNATATITNSQNETIYTSTQRATSNDFGVLQLIVGNADTFKGLDTGKLPLFIEVSVDGTKIGKTQIMTVPVAEVANTLKSPFTIEELTGKEWSSPGTVEGRIYIFNTNNEYTCIHFWNYDGNSGSEERRGKYEIEGKFIHCYRRNEYGELRYDILRWYNGVIIELDGIELR